MEFKFPDNVEQYMLSLKSELQLSTVKYTDFDTCIALLGCLKYVKECSYLFKC